MTCGYGGCPQPQRWHVTDGGHLLGGACDVHLAAELRRHGGEQTTLCVWHVEPEPTDAGSVEVIDRRSGTDRRGSFHTEVGRDALAEAVAMGEADYDWIEVQNMRGDVVAVLNMRAQVVEP